MLYVLIVIAPDVNVRNTRNTKSLNVYIPKYIVVDNDDSV